jgi:hypothetical protein
VISAFLAIPDPQSADPPFAAGLMVHLHKLLTKREILAV